MDRNAKKIVEVLRGQGFSAYLVGGCVRDLLMGLEPKDWDVATDARPEQIIKLFRKTIPVGAKFGVVIVRMGQKNYEVATFRRDLGYEDGRHPSGVEFSSPKQDAQRRDFTINGMFYDPVKKKVLDFVGGQADLERGVIRAIGDAEARFAEDKLRMLRAVRFSARFAFPLEEKTAAAVKAHAAEILEVSKERIRDELVHIFTQQHADRGLELLDESGLLQAVLPEVSMMKGVEQPPEFHPEGDVFAHTRLMLKRMRKPSPELAFGVLLHDIGKPATFKVAERIRFDSHTVKGEDISRKILRRLRFSNRSIKTICALVREHLRFIDVPRMKQSTLKRFLRLDNFDLHLELHRLDCLGSHHDLATYNFMKKKLKKFRAEQKQTKAKPQRLLTGDDLIAMGLTPGPSFRKILTAVEDAQLEGKIKTKEDAIKLAQKKARRLPKA